MITKQQRSIIESLLIISAFLFFTTGTVFYVVSILNQHTLSNNDRNIKILNGKVDFVIENSALRDSILLETNLGQQKNSDYRSYVYPIINEIITDNRTKVNGNEAPQWQEFPHSALLE